ncbi:MAG: FAD-dependent oxidoreductase [Phycisphaerales bacterium]
MPTNKPHNVIIIGAGLAGCLLAMYLAQRGHKVKVYERRPDPRAKGYIGGRSINLALSARGLWGLAGAGLDKSVLTHDAIAMPGRMLHDARGQTSFHPYSKNSTDAINSVSRGGLNLSLLTHAAALPGVEFFFDYACTDVDLDTPAAKLTTPDGREIVERADVVLGADGAFSPIRGRLQKTDRFEYSQTYLRHGYKELHVPPLGTPSLREGRFAMELHALHIWPRGGSMMIALPNLDKSFTCTLFWPYEGEHSFEQVTPANAVEFFKQHYPDAVPLMPTLEHDFRVNPVGSLVTVRCWPWQHAGKVAILGDAAHAIVPFYGQGMNCAFEDVRVLCKLLDDTQGDFAAVLPEFERRRKPNADAIAELAVDNFVEMRDLAARPDFQYRKRIERALHEAFPDAMTPQYNLVSFSTVPYTDAQAQGRRLDKVYRDVASVVHADEKLDSAEWTRRVIEAGKAAFERQSQHERPLIDITPTITPTMNVWPGDTPISREIVCELEKGATVTLSALRATVHLGAHADGPNHYGVGAGSVGEQSLRHYVGPVHVLDAPVARGSRVGVADIVGGVAQVHHPRVLIRTGTFPSFEAWNEDFAGLEPSLIDALADRGVITIGVDTPSVDTQNSKDLPAHKAILRHGIAILEGMSLAGVSPGEYELIALPLKLMEFDASPVRAVLRRLGGSHT